MKYLIQTLILICFISCQSKISVEASKEKTREIFGVDKTVDLSYINTELLTKPRKKVKLDGELYGHNILYCWQEEQYCYCFDSDENCTFEGACENESFYITFDDYDHESAGDCGSPKPEDDICKFIPK